MTDIEFISAFRSNNQKVIADFYARHERTFKRSIGAKFRIANEDVLADVYQETVCRLWEFIQREKLTEQTITTSLAAYLYGIGQKVMLEYLRKEKDVPIDDELLQVKADNDIAASVKEYELDETQQLIRETVNNMGKPCAPILLKFYWEGFSMDDIALELGYSSADSAKTQKNKCMNKLKALFRKTK